MLRRTKHPSARLMALMAVACGTTVADQNVQTAQPDVELGAKVFAAAVQGVHQRWPYLQRIDPKPIDLGNNFHFPSAADYHHDQEMLEVRRRIVLEELGVEVIAALPLLRHCTGILVPPAQRETHGCPMEGQFDLIFDLARPAEGQNRWNMRMIEIDYRPHGRSATLLELTVISENGAYRLESAEVLLTWD